MKSRVQPVLPLLIVAAMVASACSSGSSAVDLAATGEGEAALSFPSGNNDGYCASNPSAQCSHGTPMAAKSVALTFDDGPATQTLALSSWLKTQGVRATFFVNGKNFAPSPGALLAQLVADGHLVANHTQNHVDLTTLSGSAVVSELTATDAVIAPYVPSGHFVFRAPLGAWSAADYTALHASAMDKYVGPVKWDIGGAMTAAYAADWDCWQNNNGYGVMTTQQCGDRYVQEITDVGRGIVLMHDADYGDVANHSLTSGQGNTIDMVKYVVPLLKQQGYTFVRLDEVPDLAAAFPGGTTDAGAGTDSGGTCAFNPTWQQTTYANEWWIEYAISGAVASASLQVVGGATTTLSLSYDKWVGSPAAQIPSGTQVIVRATSSTNQSAQTKPFAFLVTTSPVTACAAAADAGTDAGGTKDAGTDAGGTKDAGGTADAGTKDAGGTADAGTCTAALSPTWSQGVGANNWWAEYSITTTRTIVSAYLEVVGGQTVPLSLQWSKWGGAASARIATGASVIVHAEDTLGARAQTRPFGYLSVKAPLTQACTN
jgi:peptidoglycan/xylan/chitin deacetylase (PgdA/CDA1 family)